MSRCGSTTIAVLPSEATSLVIIAMKSFAGLAGYLSSVSIDCGLAAAVTVAAVAGSLAGGRLAGRIPADTLRKAFGLFVVLMGIFVLGQQLPAGLRTNVLAWAGAGTLALITAVAALRSGHDRPAGPAANASRERSSSR